jgi:hypothetical protein
MKSLYFRKDVFPANPLQLHWKLRLLAMMQDKPHLIYFVQSDLSGLKCAFFKITARRNDLFFL